MASDAVLWGTRPQPQGQKRFAPQRRLRRRVPGRGAVVDEVGLVAARRAVVRFISCGTQLLAVDQ